MHSPTPLMTSGKRRLQSSSTNSKSTLQDQKLAHFKVFMVYEDFTTGIRGKATMDRVIEKVENHFPFTIKFWRFDLLELSEFREIAASEAADAQMVIVSAHGGPEISDGLKKWLERWLSLHSGGECALVELLDSHGSAATTWPLHQILRMAARRAGLKFFSQCVGPRCEVPGQAQVAEFGN